MITYYFCKFWIWVYIWRWVFICYITYYVI